MKKNILVMCQYFYPDYVTSAILPTQLAEDLVKKGHNVSVITGLSKGYKNGISQVSSREVYNGVDIHRVRYSNFSNKSRIGRMMNFFSFFVSVLIKLPEIVRFGIIIVYSNPPILPIIGYWAKKIAKTKLVFIGFDLYPDSAIAINAIAPNGIISKVMTYINKRVYKNADRIIALSGDMKDYMLKKHNILDFERVEVISNWYTGEIEKSKIIRNNEFEGLRNAYKLIILYAGNMGEAQEFDTIIESVIKMKETKISDEVLFIFSGHGSKQIEIEQRFVSEGVKNTKFYGFLKGTDYSDILNISDVCLVSLKKGIEGLGVPSKVYGYFAYGKPIISIMSKDTDLSQCIISNKIGFNIDQNDVEGFSKVIETFLMNPELVIEFGENSLKIHDKLYKKSISLEKYEKMILDLKK